LYEYNRKKGKKVVEDRTNERTRMYSKACRDASLELKVPSADLWTALEGYRDNRERYFIDGLHLNAEGNGRVFEVASAMIRQHFPQYVPDSMSVHKPPWFEMAGAKAQGYY
jgi:lysophospholipase L1-like esterase